MAIWFLLLAQTITAKTTGTEINKIPDYQTNDIREHKDFGRGGRRH